MENRDFESSSFKLPINECAGGLSLAWTIVWHFAAYDTPEEHPRIQGKERALIRQRRRSEPNVRKVGLSLLQFILDCTEYSSSSASSSSNALF